MACLDDRWPPFVFPCDGGYELDNNFGEIPFGAEVLNSTKREPRILRAVLVQGKI